MTTHDHQRFFPGVRVRVKEEYDIPPMIRRYQPTFGVVDTVDGDTIIVNVPIGDDDPEEHSQAVFHQAHELELA